MAKDKKGNKQKATHGVNHSYMTNKKDNYQVDNKQFNYLMVPILLIIAVIPLITKIKEYNPRLSNFNWFPNTDSLLDVFLYYKQGFIILTALFMLLVIIYKAVYSKKEIEYSPIFIPLALYAVFVILSTLFSKYRSHGISGGYEQFESVFTILGYCIITYYSYLVVKSEKDLKVFVSIIIGAVLVMSLIGVMQFAGYDIFTSELGKKLITPGGESIDLSLNFEKGRVYLTLYNPNYVGVYAALLIPILTVIALFIRDIKISILSILGIIGLIISVIGSLSLTGFICIILSMVFFLIFMRKYLWKKIFITLPVFILLFASLFVMNILTDRSLENRLKSALQPTKLEYNTTNMVTNADNIALTYKGNNLYVQYLSNNQIATIFPYDDNNQQVEATYDQNTNTFQLTDERFRGISIGYGTAAGEFYLTIDGKLYNFINHMVDNTYYYINAYGKYDKMITAPAAFTGYETLATNRGYIWSRTIPLLRDYILLGSGPDTFTMVFPQNDYLYLSSFFQGQILTKPHNLYLQMAVQTGVVSLIAFLVFYGMYFISSIRLYMKESFTSIYSKLGIAIFIGSISYMIAGITNDSSITTAPLFWLMIGVGISMNQKTKQIKDRELTQNNNKSK